jgi:hypothetical protein
LCPWLWAGDGWQHIDDTTVTAWVKTGIYKEPTLKSVDINAETFKGQVQLSDFVSTRSNMEHAGAAAKGVNGANARTTSGRALTALGLAVLMGLGGCAGISDRQQSRYRCRVRFDPDGWPHDRRIGSRGRRRHHRQRIREENVSAQEIRRPDRV